ncbi:MAG TPA: YggS family pyridoxal phosphate-dependent enzyme [Armatimonadetes bacterium]|nr:YggS family pyridoxal phosphate-dependent enzyme [Armatimonadota bacterium]
MIDIAARTAELQARIAAAAARSGRQATAVRLVAAAKGRTRAEIDAALAAGVEVLGLNYVQEAEALRAEVTRPATWHMIGPLQRNKIGAALRAFERIDTIHALRLAQGLDRRWRSEERAGQLPVLLAIRIGGEASKTGADPDAAAELLAAVQLLGTLDCQGLMTMPPPGPPEECRRHFAALRALAERLRVESGLALPVLSMGMSADFEVAIEEGATEVRLGTTLFGPRSSPG